MYIKKKSDLLYDISKFQKENGLDELSVLELIVYYCEEHELDVQEVGEILKKDKQFVDFFKEDLIRHNQIRLTEDEEKTRRALQEWI